MPRNFLPSLRSPKEGNLYGYCLPKGMVNLSLSTQGNELFLQVHGIQYVPDPDHYYYFQYRPSAGSEDDIVVKYSSKGFLSQLHTQIDDQTDDIISSIADAIEALANPTGGKQGLPKVTKTKARGVESKTIFSGIIDPFAIDDIEMINKQLKEGVNPNLEFKVEVLGNQEKEGFTGKESDRSGIFCKPRALVEIGVFGGGGKETEIVELPHPTLLEFIEIPTARFVKTEFEITFSQEGYPTYIHINKPSTALAIAQAPIALIRAIVAIPSTVLQLRINLNNMKAQQIKSEYDYRKAAFDYANKLKEWEEDSNFGEDKDEKPQVVVVPAKDGK